MSETIEKVDAAIVLKSLESEAAPLFKKLKAIEEINNQNDYDRALTLTKHLKELGKLAKEKELSLTTPLTEVVSKIRAMFKPFTTMVSQTEESIKLMMVEHVKRQEAALKRLEADFADGKIKRVSTFADKAAALTAKKSGARKYWKAVCENPGKTPKKYLVPDVAAITDDLKAGKKVAGWKLEQVDQIAI